MLHVHAMLLMLAAMAGIAGTVGAQTFPSKPLRIIVPFPPGGASDVTSRILGEQISKPLGQPVLVDNRPGAGAVIGYELGAKAAPDGYTLLMTLNSIVISPEADRLLGRTPLYELKQLMPIAQVLSDPNVLAVPASSPWQSLKDLVDDAKTRPGAISYSSSGNYGATHVSLEMLASAAGIKLLHVPYRGMGPAITGLLSNQVALTAAAPGPFASHVQAGTLRVLGTMSAARLPGLPNVPTFKEQGYPVEFYVWAGLFAPQNVPAPVVARLREAMREAVQMPTVTSVFKTAGTAAAYLDAPQFAKVVETDSALLGKVIKSIGKLE